MITRAIVDSLSRLHSEEWPIVSFYLRLDKERIDEDYTIRLKNVLREAEEQIDDRFSHDQQEAARADIERIREFFRDDADEFGEGIAIFASGPQDLWEVYAAPNEVGSQAVVDFYSNVEPLIRAMEQAQAFCTCLIARDQARIFFGHVSQFEELMQMRDESVPGQHEQGGWSQQRFERHIEDHVQRHFKHVADELFKIAQERAFRYLVIGAPDEVLSGFLDDLHQYVRDRYVGQIHVRIDASVNEIQQESLAIVDEWRRGEKERVLRVLRDEVGSQDLGVAGITNTVEALRQGQIMTLVVDDSYSAPGAVCSSCESVLTEAEISDGVCPLCGGALRKKQNILPELVVGAFGLDASIVRLMEPELQQQSTEFGHVGALLRFRVDQTPQETT